MSQRPKCRSSASARTIQAPETALLKPESWSRFFRCLSSSSGCLAGGDLPQGLLSPSEPHLGLSHSSRVFTALCAAFPVADVHAQV